MGAYTADSTVSARRRAGSMGPYALLQDQPSVAGAGLVAEPTDEVCATLRQGMAGRSASLFSLLGTGDVDVALESAVDLRIRWGVLVEFFLLQLLAPLSVPYVWARFGWQAVLNMRLFAQPSCSAGPLAWLSFLPYTMSWALASVSFVLYLVCRPELEQQGFSFAELLVALSMLTVHRIMVGVKYATMTEGELALFLRAPTERAIAYLSTIELLSGVWDPQRDTVFREIQLSWRHVLTTGSVPHTRDWCARTLLHSFAVSNQAGQWKRLLSVLGDASPFAASERASAKPPKHIVVSDVLCALVLRATRNVVTPAFRRRVGLIASLLGISFAALPLLLRTVQGRAPLGTDAFSATFCFATFLLTIFWWRTNALFLGMIASNYRRTAVEREMLSALITQHEGEVVGGSGDRVEQWPTLDLTDPSAVRVFALLAKLHMSFALRMDFYVTLVVGVIVCFCVIVCAAVWQSQHLEQLVRSEGGGA
ncbi:hypothetical protein T492DRAFT_865928, partial [Pavlovales sp. CCMP2436]